MKTGKIVRSFAVKNGMKVILRTPKWEDLDDLLKLINSLVEERAEISRNEKISRDDEIDWFSGLIARLEKGGTIFLVADVEGKVIASADIDQMMGYEKHVGVVGIVIKKGFRDLGIGTEIMRTLADQAKEAGLKMLTLSAFASNKRAIHVYEKIGFVQTGIVPKKHFKDGKYVDEVTMAKELS